MPVATKALPSVQRMRSSALASASSVGLLKGKIDGTSGLGGHFFYDGFGKGSASRRRADEDGRMNGFDGRF